MTQPEIHKVTMLVPKKKRQPGMHQFDDMVNLFCKFSLISKTCYEK
jgi:hypothetical protein